MKPVNEYNKVFVSKAEEELFLVAEPESWQLPCVWPGEPT